MAAWLLPRNECRKRCTLRSSTGRGIASRSYGSPLLRPFKAPFALCRLTFDMSGEPKGAKRPLGRPLDGGVRAHSLMRLYFATGRPVSRNSSRVADFMLATYTKDNELSPSLAIRRTQSSSIQVASEISGRSWSHELNAFLPPSEVNSICSKKPARFACTHAPRNISGRSVQLEPSALVIAAARETDRTPAKR